MSDPIEERARELVAKWRRAYSVPMVLAEDIAAALRAVEDRGYEREHAVVQRWAADLADIQAENARLREELERARGYTREPGTVNYAVIREALAPLSGAPAMAVVTMEHIERIAERMKTAEARGIERAAKECDDFARGVREFIGNNPLVGRSAGLVDAAEKLATVIRALAAEPAAEEKP